MDELSTLAGKVAVKCQRSRQQKRISVTSSRFWSIVHAECSAVHERHKTVEELETQWEAMLPTMVQFFTLFTQYWAEFKPTCRDNSLCRETNASREDNGEPSGLRFKALTSRIRPAESTSTSRTENDEDVLPGRRVRRRLDSDELCLTSSMQNDIEFCSGCLGDSFGSDTDRPIHPKREEMSWSNKAKLKQAEVMERQWELDIMTRRKEELEMEAVEYLSLQREYILRRLRKQIAHQRSSS
ncbi:unnamed protein product [Phytophthora lilii]|uniref:Unnamed protein product n=1 Tax=Phytophthora lilii TaxID=2077276 RepID=A0A9W6U315_9STRA|nr:unnamed protein product [Phytophthora lilii]